MNLCRKELCSGDSVRVSVRVSMEQIERLSAKLGVGLTIFLGVGVSMASVTNLLGRGGEINNSSVSSTSGFVLLNFQRNSLDQNLFMPVLNLCHQVGLLRLISLLASFISSSRSRRSCRIIIFLFTNSCILAISDMMSQIYDNDL